MRNFRLILVGFVVGGAFGAKLGAYLSLVERINLKEWSLIEMGFYLGAGLGIASSLVVLFVRLGVFTRNEVIMNRNQLSTKGA